MNRLFGFLIQHCRQQITKINIAVMTFMIWKMMTMMYLSIWTLIGFYITLIQPTTRKCSHFLPKEDDGNNNDQQNKMKKESGIIICDQFVQNNCTYESHRIISSTKRPTYSTSSHVAGRGHGHGRVSYSTGILEGLEHLNNANIISAKSRNVLLNCWMMKLNKNQKSHRKAIKS
jgi:hypothetical protein